ncbi:MAG: ketoacyl-ACP synthase III [Solirubrobacterales bacterium]|nr:ketoacyl-ACP synthase III [Solirubrobacterales bacterium]
MSVGAAIAGVAVALPERLVSNEQIAARLGVDPHWIAKRTGTRERPWASDDQRLTHLAAAASRSALVQAGVDPAELDLVIVATSTADEIAPNAAPLVAGLIGAERAGALDVGAACTGWLAALAMACGQIESGRARYALVVGADILSRFLDVSDRDTAPLFADGAGAAVLAATEAASGRVGPIVLHADHSGSHLIRLDRGGHIRMEGQESFRAAVASMAAVTTEALEACHCGLEDIDLFVYHQANSRIIRAVGQRLELPATESSTTSTALPTRPPRRCPSRCRRRCPRAGSRRATESCWRPSVPASPGAPPWLSGVRRRSPAPVITRR